jgi:DNA topoisomerase-3
MVKVLNVAEKPSVARALQQVFGRMPGAVDRGMRREEHQIFTHDGVQFPDCHAQGHGRVVQGPVKPHTMITTSVRGHLSAQDFPPEYGWSKCDPVALFDAPIQIIFKPDMQPLERMLKRLAGQCQILILWLDCDREGEAIGEEVRDVCLRANPRLAVYRARFSTVLDPEIRKALQTLGRLNEAFVAAVQARSQLDLRVGAAFTRFQTLRLQRRFDGLSSEGIISYGPCQFPTLGFVVERWARIETFIPEDFWYLELSLCVDEQQQQQQTEDARPNQQRPNGRPIHFSWKRTRLYDQIMTLHLYESCLEAGEAVVTSLQGRPKNKWRPVPLATVELQKKASRYLRVGSETLMSAAEELYQQGYISYPRTETERFRPEFQHHPLIEQFCTLGGGNDIGAYAHKLLHENGFQMPRAGQHDDQAHPPITPCKAVDPSTIQDPTQRGVYTLVVKHYLACCSRDAKGKETELTVRIESEEFTAKGLMILEKNWLEIYHPWERWSTGQGELPHLQVGSRIRPSSLLMKEGRTAPPQPLTEVELITLMDRNGIGTDATIAQHITTIQDREYAMKDANQRFSPTQLGIALVEGYNSMGYQLNKPDLRREMEAECNHVAAGRKTKEEVMESILSKMRQCYATATQDAHKLDEAVARHFSRLGSNNNTTQIIQQRFSECGMCHNQMALKQERTGRGPVRRKLLYCSTCNVGWSLPRGNVRPKTENENGGPPVTCPICSFQVVQVFRGEGYEGNGYHACPKCFSDPPPDHGGSRNGGEFRCFNCQHPTCSLASGTQGGNIEVFGCPFCSDLSGRVVLKKNRAGFVLSCDKYVPGQDRCPYTIWLPKECQAVSVPTGDENQNTLCNICSTGGRSVRKINMVWKPGSLPPHFGRDCTTCILCDVQLRQELRISLPQPNQVVARPGQRRQGAGGGRGGRGRGQQTQGGRGGRGGGGACFKCGQPGHYANSCPNGA